MRNVGAEEVSRVINDARCGVSTNILYSGIRICTGGQQVDLVSTVTKILDDYCGGRFMYYPLNMYLMRALPECAIKQQITTTS